MKKTVILAFIIFAFMLVLTSCNTYEEDYDDYDYDYSYEEEEYEVTEYEVTEYEAISIAKKDSYVVGRIADYHGLKFYYDPDYGTCTASKQGNLWKVTLKGTISGYKDDYKSVFEYDKTFRATVDVSLDGDVGFAFVYRN